MSQLVRVLALPLILLAVHLLQKRNSGMADNNKKVVFVAFAIEDERQRDFLKGQALLTKSPFDYIDMSVKEAYDKEWKERVRTRIRRSDGVIALVSKNSKASSGQQWELTCAKEEKKKIRGIRAYTEDKTELVGITTVVWTWDNIKNFIDSL
jgi:Thoeris protein ThsB, TIR-like domain